MPEVADLVRRWASRLDDAEGDVLDLACGAGQNGLFLARRDEDHGRCDRNVVLLDRNIEEAVVRTADLPEAAQARVKHEEIDLETEENVSPLPKEAFGVVLVFNYLHRALAPNLRECVKPGGLVLYKTFTWEHPSVGVRPRNPAFLLGPCELKSFFAGWEMLDFFEGIEERAAPEGGEVKRAAVSSILCRKPTSQG